MRPPYHLMMFLFAALAGHAPHAAADKPMAIAVKAFTGKGSADVAAMAPGYSGLLITDWLGRPNPPCKLTQVEWIRRADAMREIELGKSPHADRKTFPKPGQLTQPDVFVSGRLTDDGSNVSWVIEAHDATTGELIAEDHGSAPGDKILDQTEAIADRLSKKLCKVKLAYRISGVMDEATVAGIVCGKLDKPFTATSPEVAGAWTFTPAGERGGSFSYTAANVGGATGFGSGKYTVIQRDGAAVALKLSGSGSIRSPLGVFSAPITELLTLTPISSCERVGNQ